MAREPLTHVIVGASLAVDESQLVDLGVPLGALVRSNDREAARP